jgi:hypothetical protein
MGDRRYGVATVRVGKMEGKSCRERDVRADFWRGKERGSGSRAYIGELKGLAEGPHLGYAWRHDRMIAQSNQSDNES